MMSSDGCSARQSMYSANMLAAGEVLGHLHRLAGLGAEVRRRRGRGSASWSSSGMPSSIPITRIGICAPRSATKSNRPAPTSGSRLRAQNSRIFGSSAATFLGVNTRDSRLRWIVCVGGSSKMTTPGGISMFALISSRMPPRPEMKVVAVDEAALDVVEAAHRVEVVRLVVVERRLLAQPAEHRVRVARRSRRRTGRSTRRSQCWSSPASPSSNSCQNMAPIDERVKGRAQRGVTEAPVRSASTSAPPWSSRNGG